MQETSLFLWILNAIWGFTMSLLYMWMHGIRKDVDLMRSVRDEDRNLLIATAANVTNITSRLDRIEGKLDTLLQK